MRDMKFKAQGTPTLPEGGHEKRDLNFKAVMISGAVLLVIMFGTSVGLIVFDRFMNKWADGLDPTPVSRLSDAPDRLPPLPRLQVSPQADMDTMLAEEKVRLEHYVYDEPTGAVRIPTERAIDLTVAKLQADAAASTMTVVATMDSTGTAEGSAGVITEGPLQ